MEGRKDKKKSTTKYKYKFCYFQFNIVVAFVNASRTKIKRYLKELKNKQQAETR